MKKNRIRVTLSIVLCQIIMSLYLNAQTSQVIYNSNGTSGSLTLSETDCTPGWTDYYWLISVPANTPIKITTQLHYEAYLYVASNTTLAYYSIFDGDEPGSPVTTTVYSSNGTISVYCEESYYINPTNAVFTINFEVDSTIYSGTNDLHIPGKITVGSSLDVFGNTNIAGTTSIQGTTRINSRLGIGASPYDSRISVSNNNQDNRAISLSSSKSSTSSLYGLYSSASNGTGNVYGIYSTVSGVAGKKWAGYFNGGDLEVNGGNLKVSGGSTLMGNVGIGTVTPLAKLHINSGANNNYATILATSNDGNNLVVSSHDTQPHSCTVFKISHEYSNNPAKRNNGYISFYRGASDEGGFLEFGTYGLPRMIIDPSGKVGIGTSAPDEMLTVNGKIHAKEVIVALTGPLADYVFEPEYHLKPLHEVEQFVRTNKHLPGIPSAAQVEEKGLSMGEMQNKLLQKVEELTLYIIEQDKKIKLLEEKLK